MAADTARRLRNFPGGLALPENKEAATARPILPLPYSGELILALHQHAGEPAEPVVSAGARVLKGELLAKPSSYVSAAIHAPTSGIIRGIAERRVPHPAGRRAPCILLEPDGRDAMVDPEPVADWENADPARLRERVRDAGIVGLGGASFPSHVKLAPARPVELLILNGAECEPYISCDDMLMRERARDVVDGARIMLRALGAPRCTIAIEDNKPQAKAALRAALDAVGDERLELVLVPSIYPEGGERQLIQTLTGREVPSGGLPLDIGLVCHNVGTAAAVADAVLRGLPLIARIVTVAGGGVKEQRNVEALIGTPICDLVYACGGYTDAAERLIMGGPMMGFALQSDAIPIVKATNCILVAARDEIEVQKNPLPCIRCGECAAVCPASLLPQQLYWHARAGEWDRVVAYDLFDCIECGCCDYVCPSHIPLVSWFRHAKSEIRAQRAERARSDHARERFEARQERLQRAQAEREERLRRKQESLAADGRKAEIEAAIERAKARKSSAGEGGKDA
ncbi:MAG TPA: electron transport complex subunit RsxC [Gammaproteobacteria bacterium]|nr:electron transport complex subunit RsxC [Gammaproteobacteria bacterium]